MLYQKDFQHLSRHYVSTRYPFGNRNRPIEDNSKIKEQKDSWNGIGSFVKMYLLRSSIHGVRYVVAGELKLFERLIWSLIVILSIFFTTYISILLSNRFYGSPLQTVVESTMHPVKNIYFPAVTICNNNRVDWTKLEEGKRKFITNASKEVEDLFTKFVSRMEILDYASFDTFDTLLNVSLKPLESINMSQLSEFFAHSCEDMFLRKCWWRYKEFPCCEIFVKQKSEYGYCYAFNSVVNEIGLKRWMANEPDWPMRTYSFGDWSGLRIYLVARTRTKVPGSENPIGVQVITHYPFAWPNNGILVPAGTSASVSLKPKLSYAMPSTRRYDPKSRECIFMDEAKKANYMNLPGLDYMMSNCLSGCRQNYLVLKCNCTVEAFFPIGNFRACNATDFHCLIENNDLFNLEIVDIGFVDTQLNAMICPCLHECSALDYQTEILPMHLAKENFTSEMILLDVHFQHGTLIKYRTDVVYSWLDLLVAFGGIAGLFMGASVLSGIEFLYYFTIGIVVHWRDRRNKSKMFKVKAIEPINSHLFTRKKFSVIKY